MRLIDADKLRKDIQFVLDTLGEPTKYGLRQAMSIIDRTPTVDAEPIRHGQWEEHAVSIKDVPTEECSICGEWSYGDCERYCPKCGALMNEIEVEEER